MELLIQLGILRASCCWSGWCSGAPARSGTSATSPPRSRARATCWCSTSAARRPIAPFREATLVVGSVVIAEDYFKRIAAALQGLVGGRAHGLRVADGPRPARGDPADEGSRRGAAARRSVFNVRFETAVAGGGTGGARRRCSRPSSSPTAPRWSMTRDEPGCRELREPAGPARSQRLARERAGRVRAAGDRAGAWRARGGRRVLYLCGGALARLVPYSRSSSAGSATACSRPIESPAERRRRRTRSSPTCSDSPTASRGT